MNIFSPDKLLMVLDSIQDPVIVVDVKNKTVTSNAAARDIEHSLDRCLLREEFCGNDSCTFYETNEKAGCLIKKSLLLNNYSSGFFKLQHRQIRFTTYLHSITTTCEGYIVLHMKHMNAPYEHSLDTDVKLSELVSHYDVLTGLPDIFFLSRSLQDEIQKALVHGTMFAVVFIDINQFNRINHTFGREQGDSILKIVSQRIHHTLRASDQLFRQGGDVFIAIISDAKNDQAIGVAAKRIFNAISLPLAVQAETVQLKATGGISIYPQDGASSDMLMRNADIALQRAKNDALTSFHFFTASMAKAEEERVLIEARLHTAVDRNELALVFQPLIETTSGKVIGAEALLRWNSPDFGPVPPSKFIPIAEKTGAIIAIGEWVIQTACRQISSWILDGFPPIAVSVNVSMGQFSDPGLIRVITDALEQSTLSPQCLCLEITENSIMDNPESVIEIMSAISSMGVSLAIDDFGTGYSSLNYLKKLPVRKLKIDRAFIQNITRDEADAAIVKTVINLAHNFNLTVNAEGVETLEHLQFLQELGCDELQGYFLSKPLNAPDFATFWTNTLLLHGIGFECADGD